MTQHHPSAEVLESFRRGELELREMLAVDQHLAECDVCDTDVVHATSQWSQALGGGHLTYGDMERWLDGRVSAEEAADFETHVASCEMCRDELEDLRSVAQPRRERKWIPYAIAAAVAGIVLLLLLMRPATTPHAPPVVRRPVTPPVTKTAEPRRDAFAEEMQRLDPSLRDVATSLLQGTLPSEGLLRSLNPAAGRERGPAPRAGDLAVVSPVGVVIDDDRPLFRWTGTPPFTIEIFDEKMQLIATSERIEETECRLARALPRGKTLMWQVRHEADGRSQIAPRPPAPPARFRVLGTDARNAIAAAKSPLEAALLLAREGMIDEARDKLRETHDAPEIRKMMQTLREYGR